MTVRYFADTDTLLIEFRDAPVIETRDLIRDFYDVSGSTVEILAIVPKAEAQSWLAQFGSTK